MRDDFKTNGYIILRNVFSKSEVSTFKDHANNLYEKHKDSKQPNSKLDIDFTKLNKIKEFINLPANNPILHAAREILSDNIFVSYMGLSIAPQQLPSKQHMKYHRDNGRAFQDIERLQNNSSPLFNIKCAIYLTCTTQPDSGIFFALPGSHLISDYPMNDRRTDHSQCIPLSVNEGDVIIFDTRLWHTRKLNLRPLARKVIFLDYSYRWVEPKCNMRIENQETINQLDKQLKQLYELDTTDPWKNFAPKNLNL